MLIVNADNSPNISKNAASGVLTLRGVTLRFRVG